MIVLAIGYGGAWLQGKHQERQEQELVAHLASIDADIERKEGSWMTGSAYRADISDSSMKMAEATHASATAAGAAADGTITMSRYGELALADEYVAAIDTQRRRLRNKTPPEQFSEVHALFMQALDACRESAVLAGMGARQHDVTMLRRADQEMTRCGATAARATELMP